MNAEAASNIKFRQYENEIEKKKRDEDKIELMTHSVRSNIISYKIIRKEKRNV